jgi:hypothetical protein
MLFRFSYSPSNSNDGGDNFSPVGPTGTIKNGNSGGGGVPLYKHSKMARTLVSDRRRMTEGAAPAVASSNSVTARLGRRTGVKRAAAVAVCSTPPSMDSSVVFSNEKRVCCFRIAKFILRLQTNQRRLHKERAKLLCGSLKPILSFTTVEDEPRETESESWPSIDAHHC